MNVKPRFIISDLHLGDGRSAVEDFDAAGTENFVNFFCEVAVLGGAKVILNGDFIDFPQIPIASRSVPPHQFLGTTEAESVERLQQAMTGHAEECEALRLFLSKPGNELLLIAGNHDIDFCWPRVRHGFRQRIGGTEQNFRFGMVYKEAGLFVTHGHQYSDDNRIDAPIDLTFNRLNNCWGTLFVEQFFNLVEARYPMLDNVRPTWKVALSAILHDELLVTAQFAANFLIFFTRFGMPLSEYASSALFGWKPKKRAMRRRDVSDVLTHVPLDELRDKLEHLRAQPEFRRAFDAAFETLEDEDWGQLLRPADVGGPPLHALLQPAEPDGQSRALFARGDNYHSAAQIIARHHSGTKVVVMGHTHAGLAPEILNVKETEITCQYLNTGAWTRTYDIPWWQLPRIEKLMDSALFHSTSGVVRCTGAHDTLDARYFNAWEKALG